MSEKNTPSRRPRFPGEIRFTKGGKFITAAEIMATLSLASDVADLTEKAERYVQSERRLDHTLVVIGTANTDIL